MQYFLQIFDFGAGQGDLLWGVVHWCIIYYTRFSLSETMQSTVVLSFDDIVRCFVHHLLMCQPFSGLRMFTGQQPNITTLTSAVYTLHFQLKYYLYQPIFSYKALISKPLQNFSIHSFFIFYFIPVLHLIFVSYSICPCHFACTENMLNGKLKLFELFNFHNFI